MAWQVVQVIGITERSVVDHCSRTPEAHVEMQLPGDDVPGAECIEDMWFLTLTITGIETTPESKLIDNPDEGMSSIAYTGTITGTDFPVQIIFFGDTLDRLLADFDLRPGR